MVIVADCMKLVSFTVISETIAKSKRKKVMHSDKELSLNPVSDPGKQFRFFQIGKGLPHILKTVGFQGNEGVEIIVTQELKKTREIKITPSRRQMLVPLAMIVVQMQLP